MISLKPINLKTTLARLRFGHGSAFEFRLSSIESATDPDLPT
jgi:hypothetical protein